jgi:hypothetical protein
MHAVHNQGVGRFTLATLADMVNVYGQVWPNPSTRPTPVYVDVTYNWQKFYKEFGVPISGFTKTKLDPTIVGAFRFRKAKSGLVEMHWKRFADGNSPYLGMDGQPESPGFCCMRSYPAVDSFPDVFPPARGAMNAKQLKSLLCPGMKEALTAEGLDSSVDWLETVARNGVIPTFASSTDSSSIGVTCQIGSAGRLARIQVIKERDNFWELPESVLCPLELADPGSAPRLPEVRYTRKADALEFAGPWRAPQAGPKSKRRKKGRKKSQGVAPDGRPAGRHPYNDLVAWSRQLGGRAAPQPEPRSPPAVPAAAAAPSVAVAVVSSDDSDDGVSLSVLAQRPKFGAREGGLAVFHFEFDGGCHGVYVSECLQWLPASRSWRVRELDCHLADKNGKLRKVCATRKRTVRGLFTTNESNDVEIVPESAVIIGFPNLINGGLPSDIMGEVITTPMYAKLK